MILQTDIDELNKAVISKSIVEVLAELCTKYGDRVVFSTSFGIEDQVISHIIFSNDLKIKVFTLDTGRLFNETYKTYNATLERYKKAIEVYFPNTQSVQQLLTEKGPFSFYTSVENRKECCHIRKVEPLERALKGASIWITGIRADQSEARNSNSYFEWDSRFGIIKYNPLLNWSLEEVKKFILEHNIPYNVLHDKGFVSIGCEPCTRAIKPNEDFRAGRWWWENNSMKECGLHTH